MSAPHPSVSAADIRQWTNDSRIPGQVGELSPAASLMIASGVLSPAGRALMVRRLTSGYPLPTLPYSYSELRRLQESILYIEDQLRPGAVPNLVATVLRARVGGMIRKREDARKAIVLAKGVFASSARGIRRERKENLYLEIDERERLFAGLLATPTANLPVGGGVRRAGSAAVDKVATFVSQLAGRSAGQSVEEWANEAIGASSGPPPGARGGAVFVDGYETLLFIAGYYFDRISANPAWRSDYFEMQRAQVNLNAELSEIASDIIALRTLRIDLDAARARGGWDSAFAEHVDSREAALRPVWTELLERVAALAEITATVDSAAVELRLLDEFDRTVTIDERIDHLLSRSGDREMSADNSRRLSQQVRVGEEQLKIYRDVLQGNIARIAPAEPRELP
ncbi:MAG: hypothetical protein QM658_05750 [Gordonia sp. (in: high G+C Gram-positive bacteria)]